MENIYTVSGELDGDFVGDAMCNDDRGVNQSSGGRRFCRKGSSKRASIQPFNKESVSLYSNNELVKKKEVNSTGSRLSVLRLLNHLSLPRI